MTGRREAHDGAVSKDVRRDNGCFRHGRGSGVGGSDARRRAAPGRDRCGGPGPSPAAHRRVPGHRANPRTVEVLDQRGLLPRFGDIEMSGLGHFGGIPLDFGVLGGGDRAARTVPQSATESVLESWARELGADIRRDHEFTGLTDHGGHVEAQVRGPAGQQVLSCRFLVGCDGAAAPCARPPAFDFPGTPATTEAPPRGYPGCRSGAAHGRRPGHRRHGHDRPARGRRPPRHRRRTRCAAAAEDGPARLRRGRRRLEAAHRHRHLARRTRVAQRLRRRHASGHRVPPRQGAAGRGLRPHPPPGRMDRG